MKSTRSKLPWAPAGVVLLALTLPAMYGCDANDGPAEEMGESIDDAADDTRDAVDDAIDDMEDGIDDFPEDP